MGIPYEAGMTQLPTKVLGRKMGGPRNHTTFTITIWITKWRTRGSTRWIIITEQWLHRGWYSMMLIWPKPPIMPVCNQFFSGSVTGASVHTPIQRNIPYGQTTRWSVYKTRWPKHPHLQILQYKIHSQGPATWIHYMESCPTQPSIRLPLRIRPRFSAESISPRTVNTPLMRWEPTNFRVGYSLLRALSWVSSILHESMVPTWS